MSLSSIFNAKVLKGCLLGMGGAAAAAVVLPVLTVSAPLVIAGGLVGGIIGLANKNEGPKFGG